MLNRVRCFLLVGILPLFVACGPDTIYPQIELEGKRVAVIPFEEGHLGFYESLNGRELAKAVIANVQGTVEEEEWPRMVPFDELSKHMREDGVLDVEELARAAEADYMIEGRIARFEVGGDQQIGFYRGHSIVEFVVRDLNQEGKVVLERTEQSRYPYGYFTTGVVGQTTEGPEPVRQGLLQETALMIGRNFYPYDRDQFQKR